MAENTRRQRIEAMLEADPTDAFLRYGLAMEYVATGDDQGAVAQFERLLQDNPDYVAGYFHGGQALMRLGKTNEARELLERGIVVARRTGDLHAAEEMAGVLGMIG
jgi:tetratricopeptide (TPR) repeat protein